MHNNVLLFSSFYDGHIAYIRGHLSSGLPILDKTTSNPRLHTSPSQAPEYIRDTFVGCFITQLMTSRCPSSEPKNGFANTRSNLAAFDALTYSRGSLNGCKFLS